VHLSNKKYEYNLGVKLLDHYFQKNKEINYVNQINNISIQNVKIKQIIEYFKNQETHAPNYSIDKLQQQLMNYNNNKLFVNDFIYYVNICNNDFGLELCNEKKLKCLDNFYLPYKLPKCKWVENIFNMLKNKQN